MKKTIIKLLLFIIPLVAVTLPITHFLYKYNDLFYSKLLTPSQSLIIGSSRALYALSPSELKGDKYSFLNFAFSMSTSPYGPTYNKRILEKIPGNSGGFYILEVSPGAFRERQSTNQQGLGEEQQFLALIKTVNMSPNLDYILNFTRDPLYILSFRQLRRLRESSSGRQPAGNGWIAELNSSKGKEWQKRVNKGLRSLEEKHKNSSYSELRFSAFKNLIMQLKLRGQVFIVRLPIQSKAKELEDRLYPNFDNKIKEMTTQLSVPYLNFISASGDYETVDHHHFTKDSAIEISRLLSQKLR